MSTAHVYSSPLQGTVTEKTLTTNSHPYATSHLSGEREVAKRHQLGDVAGVILRCANGFGTPMDPSVNIWHVLVNDLCNQVALDGSMTLHSSGLQERNFIPIADICSAFLHFLNVDAHSVGDGLFNLGGPKSMTVLEMANVIAERSRSVLHIDPPIIRPQQTEPEVCIPLDYRIDKLISTGFSCVNDINFEIDQLLKMCKNQGRMQ
jgi:UDP-glucose 4-epimerase